MSQPEIHSMIVLSTGHVSAATATVLDRSSNKQNEYGWLVSVDWQGRLPDQSLPECFDYAKRLGATYILFDRDADVVHGLASYDW